MIDTFDPAELPDNSFTFGPGMTVTDPRLFAEALRRDIAAGPGSPRTTGLLADLRKVKEMAAPSGAISASRARKWLHAAAEPARLWSVTT